MISNRTLRMINDNTMTPLRLSTDRLLLIPATLDHLAAELESPMQLALLIQAEVPREWPPGQYDRSAQEFFYSLLERDNNANVGWYTWYAITYRPPSTVIAAGGFLGPPNDRGVVEIGYSVMPAWRHQGFAAEMVRALTAHAFGDPRVQKIIAHTASENQASSRVLLRTGFEMSNDTNDQGEIRYELMKQESNAS